MSLKNLAIVVDGPTEETSLRAKFQMTYYDCPNFRNGPGNGVTYSIEGYTKGVLPTLIFLLNSSVRAIILIPDLEKRKIDFTEFAEQLKEEIISSLIQVTEFTREYLTDIIFVCPPNIMFENWIISDVENLKKVTTLIHQNASQIDFDGKNGTSELQKMMVTKYKKTVHAQVLFKKIDEAAAIANSPSFKLFIEKFNSLKDKHCQ